MAVDIVEQAFPFLPRQIEIDHVDREGLLLSPSQMEIAIADLVKNNKTRTSILKRSKKDKEHHLQLDVVEVENLNEKGVLEKKYVTVYLGARHDKHLGAGAFGKVKLAQLGKRQNQENAQEEETQQPGKWYALKVQPVTQDKHFTLAREVELVRQSGTSTSAMLLRQWDSKGTFFKPTKKKQGMLTDFVYGQDLAHLRASEINLRSSQWMKLATNIAKAHRSIYHREIIHRDIKTANVMADPVTGKVTIVDFGLAKNIQNKLDQRIVGSKSYVAPELIFPRQYPDLDKQYQVPGDKSEMWLLGVLLGETLGLGYFNAINRFTMRDKNDAYLEAENDQIPNKILRDNVIDFITERMMNPHPAQRCTFDEAVTFLEEMQHLYFDWMDAKKIGILDLNEYATSSSKEKKELIEVLKHCQEVWMVDAGHQQKNTEINPEMDAEPQRSVKEYMLLRRELEDAGVLVGEKLFSCGDSKKTNELINAIPKKLQQNEQDELRHFFHVTHKEKVSLQDEEICVIQPKSIKKTGNYSQAIQAELESHFGGFALAEKQFNLIKKRLTQEVERIENKYGQADSRLPVINGTIFSLQKQFADKTLNYKKVKESLDHVQKEMWGKSTIRNVFARWFPQLVSASQAQKEMKALQSEIETLKQEHWATNKQQQVNPSNEKINAESNKRKHEPDAPDTDPKRKAFRSNH